MRAFAIVILVIALAVASWAPAAAAPGAAAERSGKITADRLNLRGSPSTSGEVVGSLTRDEVVTILDEQGEWYHIQMPDGRDGWAAAKYVQVTSETPGGSPATGSGPAGSEEAKQAMTPAAATPHSEGGGSVIRGVLKWGCLLGAGVCGYLSYDEYTKGNSSYDDYEARYKELTPPVGSHSYEEALALAEPLRVEAEDHDQKSKNYAIAAGVLGAAFLVQELFLGGKDDDQAARIPAEVSPAALLACDLRGGQVRAAVTLARF
jgi:hypothetical protein